MVKVTSPMQFLSFLPLWENSEVKISPSPQPVVPRGCRVTSPELCIPEGGTRSKPASHTMLWVWGHCVVFYLVCHLNVCTSVMTGLPQTHFFIVLAQNRKIIEHPQGLKKEKHEAPQTAKYAKLSLVFFEQANLYFLSNIFKYFFSLLALENSSHKIVTSGIKNKICAYLLICSNIYSGVKYRRAAFYITFCPEESNQLCRLQQMAVSTGLVK